MPALIGAAAASMSGGFMAITNDDATTPTVAISQVYGGGGNSGATYKNDFIELYNYGTTAVSLAGWSVQYAAATGTSWQVTNLTGSILPGHYYLVQEAVGSGGTTALPTPDATGTISMSGTTGKVALSSSTTAFSGTNPAGPSLIDFVGFGTANASEGSPAPAPSNTTADIRTPSSQDTNNNAADFTTGAPNPRNSAFTTQPPGSTVSINSVSTAEGNGGTKTLDFTITRTDTTTAFSVDVTTANGTATAGSDYVAKTQTLTFAANGPATQTFSVTIDGDTTVEPNETFTATLSNIQNTTGTTTLGTASGTGTIQNDDFNLTPIYTIQGTGFASPLAGQQISTSGIVTAVDTNGYYLQDPTGDGNAATSDGIFVFTSTAPTVAVGDSVDVSGTVQEFKASTANGAFSTTELSSITATTILTNHNTAPAAVIIGPDGLSPPTSNLAAGNAFYESLEGMRVTIENPVSVGPTNSFGEIFTVAGNGVGATGLNSRGEIIETTGATPVFGSTDSDDGDFNPERIKIDGGLVAGAVPSVNTGTHFADVTGILNYDFDNFGVSATSPVTVTQASTLTPTVGTLAGDATHLTFGSYNIENFSSTAMIAGQGPAKVQTLATQILTNLNAPDIIALQEVQDDNGPTDNGVITASTNLQNLVNGINAKGGAQYAFIDNPFIGNDTNGGQPGGNIRTAFLYRTDVPGLSYFPGSLATIGADGRAITSGPDTSQQTDPNNPFYQSRPPLSAQFMFNGQLVTIVDNHFTSKGGSGDLEGSVQPSFNGGEVERAGQAQAVNTYVDSLLAANPNAKVIVTGDLNEFTGEEPLDVLEGTATISGYSVPGTDPINATATYTPGGTAVLTDLESALPADQQFDYNFQGNAESLVHTLVTGSLTAGAQFQPIHINSDFANQTSDHDPLLASFVINAADTTAPTLAASSPADNATDIAIGADVVLTFNEAVKAGTGNIILRPATGADISIPVGSSQVTFTGATVTINPTADLRPGVAYDVIIGSGVITDASGNAFAGIAQDALDFTTSFTIPAGSFTQSFTISDPGTFTLLAGTTRTQTAGTAVQATSTSATPTTIDIEGTLNDTAAGQRAIRANLTNGQVMVGANGLVQALNGDAIQAQSVNGTFNVTNNGQIISATSTNNVTPGGPAPGAAYALNFNAAVGAAGAAATDFTSGGTITNGSTSNTAALIRSDSGDAIRLGSHETLINYGTIIADGPVNDSSTNNSFNNTSTATPYDISRGVRVNQSGAVSDKIENYGTIQGSQHGVDVGQTTVTGLVVDNYAGATILGHNGSGVGSDTTGAAVNTVTVNNYGTIRGEYAPTYDRAGLVTVDGDGDGVDVDGSATVMNHAGALIAGSGASGVLNGTGAGGYDSNGRANSSEGLSLGGGIVVNDGTISGANTGIVVNNDANPDNTRSGVAATSITNGATGTIIGQSGYAIRLENKTGTAADNDTIVNAGSITGNGSIPDPNAIVARQDGNPDPGVSGTLDGVTYTSANAGNARFIRGDGSAIQTGEGADTLSNYGTITGNDGRALNLEGGDDSLTLHTGSTVSGLINGGAGNDTLTLALDDRSGTGDLGANSGATTGTLVNVTNFETLAVAGGAWTLGDAQAYAAGASIARGASLTIGASGALSAAVADAGQLVFAHTGTLAFADAITGDGSVRQNSADTLVLSGASSYSGGTTIAAGTLDVASRTGAGTGVVTFATGAQTLAIETAALDASLRFANTVAGFATDGDMLDVRGIGTAAAAILDYGTDLLTVKNAAGDALAVIQLSGDYTGKSFAVSADGSGGTNIALTTDQATLTAALANDTGTSGHDGITSDPTIRGVGLADTIVSFKDETGAVLGQITTGADGSYAFKATHLSDAAHTITASQTGPSGLAATASVSFTLDTTAPVVAASASDAEATSAAGASVVFAATSNDQLDGTNDPITYTEQLAGGGTKVVRSGDTFAIGTHSVIASATDAAGNPSAATSFSFVVTDKTPPTVTASADNPTVTATSPVGGVETFTGSSSDAVDGSSDPITYIEQLASGGTKIVHSGDTFAVGTHTIIASATDTHGNTGSSAPFSFRVNDGTVPPTPSAPALAAGSDSGASPSDGITRVAAPVLVGTAQAGATVTLYEGGTTVVGQALAGSNGTYQIQSAALADGPHALTVTATSPGSGNTSAASPALGVTIDTMAPGAPTIASSGGRRVGTTTPIFDGSAEAGATVTLYEGTRVVATTVAGSDGTYRVATAPLANGSHDIAATATDVAGNSSTASAPTTIVIRGARPPRPVAPTLAAASDSGASSSDDITNDSTPTFTGRADAGSTVVLTTNAGREVGRGTVAADGTYSISTTALRDETFAIGATEIDTAGNSSLRSTPTRVTIDTRAPAAPGTPALTFASGRGNGGVTSDATPTVTGRSEAFASVTLYDSDGTTVLGTATSNGAGIYRITSSALADGAHALTVKATDAAGNTSTASAARTIRLDTTPPAAPSAPQLAATSDTGISSTDLLTSNHRLRLTGTAEAGATVSIYSGSRLVGTAIADAQGTYALRTAYLYDGARTLTATATDAAGNVSAASAGAIVTIDSQAPGRPAAPRLTAASDSGASPSDGITNVTTPTVTGVAEAGAVLTLSDRRGVLGQATAAADGSYTITSAALSEGRHFLSVSATDAAGNTSASSRETAIVIDTSAPGVAITTAGGPTNTATQTLSGTGEAGTSVTLLDNGQAVGTTTVNRRGRWSEAVTFSSAGTHSLVASDADAAGNVGTSGPVVFSYAPASLNSMVQAMAAMTPPASAAMTPTGTTTQQPPTLAASHG